MDLHERIAKFGMAIESIWIADVAHQGASGILNEEKLGNDRMNPAHLSRRYSKGYDDSLIV